jgi:hypothetical protein
MDVGITSGLKKSAELMEARLRGELYEPKSGRVYERDGRTHVASAPGEPPATDYGALEASLGSEMETPRRAVVGVGTEHALPLEFDMSRPWFTPMGERMAKEVPEIITTEIRARVK